MIVMLDTSERLEVAEQELDMSVEQLLTPLTRFNLQRPNARFAIDNGAFSRFNAKGFLSLLERERERRQNCRFVAVPDVVGSARRTAECFDHWFPLLSGWPLAFVCQDGQEDLPIPFEFIDALFIGGSTEWKLSTHAAQCVKAAQVMGKWVHIGRINTVSRFEAFEDLRADSCDGSGLAMYSYMRERIAHRKAQPNFLYAEAMQ